MTGAGRRVLVFDSGVGGLTVLAAARAALPGAAFAYLADDAGFPYGGLAPDVLLARVEAAIGAGLAAFPADAAVIACNTASTLALP
ncbi:MAG: glutamate racemase, partial [Hyphomicrobiales bacterium]|nr:glutamate racemase [Hyphomicrobiales bacterium]